MLQKKGEDIMGINNVFRSEDIKKKVFEDRWVRFAFGHQGKIDSKNLNLGIVEFDRNTKSSPHIHGVEEALFVLSGEAKMTLGNDTLDIEKDDFIYIPANTEHSFITSVKKIRILFIFGGDILIKR
jgi:mannose-6-phosphate isomerase-like protein (cupin superfamily)